MSGREGLRSEYLDGRAPAATPESSQLLQDQARRAEDVAFGIVTGEEA